MTIKDVHCDYRFNQYYFQYFTRKNGWTETQTSSLLCKIVVIPRHPPVARHRGCACQEPYNTSLRETLNYDPDESTIPLSIDRKWCPIVSARQWRVPKMIAIDLTVAPPNVNLNVHAAISNFSGSSVSRPDWTGWRRKYEWRLKRPCSFWGTGQWLFRLMTCSKYDKQLVARNVLQR